MLFQTKKSRAKSNRKNGGIGIGNRSPRVAFTGFLNTAAWNLRPEEGTQGETPWGVNAFW